MATWGSYAARSGTTMDEAWKSTFTIDNLQALPTEMTGPAHAVQSVVMGAIGCGAGIELYAHGDEADVSQAGWAQEAKDEVDAYHTWRESKEATPPPPPPPVNGSWWLWRFYVTAPGDMAEHFICTGVAHDGTTQYWYGAGSYAAALTLGVTNLLLKSRSGDTTPSDRSTRDFVDQHVADAWHVTDTTVSTATMVVPDSVLGSKSDLSASGSWGSMPGVGEMTGDWPATLAASYSITYNGNSTVDTVYASILPQWSGVDLNLEALADLYYDAAWHHWWSGSAFQSPWPPSGKTPTFEVSGANGQIEAQRIAGSATDTMAWSGSSGVPYLLKVDISSGKWNDAGGDWGSAIQFDVAGLKDSSGNREYLGIGTSAQYSEANHSWYTEDRLSPTVQADVLASWAAANGEDVGSGSLTDLPAPIGVPDLTQSVDSDPWTTGLLTVTQAAVNVHKPAGVSRPSLWVASGGATITAQTDTTLTIEINSTATAPAITRTLVTRYWDQLDRLASQDADTSHAFDPDWPIKLAANLSHAVPVADPDYSALTKDEDVTTYDNFSYLKLPFSAMGAAGGLTLTLAYNALDYVLDPCYTCHEHRYGAEGEFSFSKGAAQSATYANDYLGNSLTGPGAQTFYIDLRCPAEGDLSRGDLQHVATLTLSGFTVPGSGTDTYTVDAANLELCDGPVAGSGHLLVKAKRPWNWAANFTNFSAVHDGAAILAPQYGFEQFERVERGLKGTQFRQHCPTSSATTDISSAKSLSRFCDELQWQEGFTATFQTGTFTSRYRDADSVDFFTSGRAYWWWMFYEPDGALQIPTAATVRSWTIAPGVPYTVYVRHYLQGAAHGLLKDASGTYRTRSGGSVALYKRPDGGGAASLVGTYASDAHGRWVSDPLAEDGFSYYITVAGSDTELGRAVNREWSSAAGRVGVDDPWLVENHTGGLYLFYSDGSRIWVTYRPSVYSAWQTRRFVGMGEQPVAALEDSGALTCSVLYNGAIHTVQSRNGGRSWA